MISMKDCLLFLIIFVSIKAENIEVGSTSDMTVKSIELTAIGRAATFGDLYDARSEQFAHFSLFKDSLPNAKINTIQNRQTKYKYSVINTMEDKFKIMDISAGLKLSVIGGLLGELEGSGKFLNDKKSSAKSSKASIMLSISTEYQKISITDTELQRIINFDALEQIDATHVVVGIQWGGNLFISFEDKNEENKDERTIQGNLEAKLKYLQNEISGFAQVKIHDEEQFESNHIKFEIFGDILPETNPNTLSEAVKFVKNATSSLQSANNGRGKSMKYTLIPLRILRNLLNVPSKINSLINDVDEATVTNCVELFDNIYKVGQSLNDLDYDVKRFEKQILNAKVEYIRMTKSKYEIYKLEAQKNLSDNLVLVRSGIEPIAKLQEIVKFASEHPYSWSNIQMKDFSIIEKEIKFLKFMLKMNVTLLDKRETIQMFLLDKYQNDVYILFYSNEFSTIIEKPMETFRDMIQNRSSYGDQAIFAMVKNELYNLTDTKVSLYRKTKLVIDCYEVNTEVLDINKPELWSFYFMQTQLANVLRNPVPCGFIYVQMKDQESPQIIWPNVNWIDVTEEYSGLFFRAEGGESSHFGSIQEQSSPKITNFQVFHTLWENPDIKLVGELDISDLNGTSAMLSLGDTSYPVDRDNFERVSMGITVEQCEVRPINTAIRIWKRI